MESNLKTNTKKVTYKTDLIDIKNKLMVTKRKTCGEKINQESGINIHTTIHKMCVCVNNR